MRFHGPLMRAQLQEGARARRRNKFKAYAQEMRRAPTEAERRLWYALEPRPETWLSQVVMADRYILDFYCRKARLCVEVDGYHFEPEQRRRDELRDADLLQTLHVQTIRFTNQQVLTNLAGVLAEIDRHVRHRYHNGPSVQSQAARKRMSARAKAKSQQGKAWAQKEQQRRKNKRTMPWENR